MATGTLQRSKRRPPLLDLIGRRVNEGLSREQLALRAGISRETIRMAEHGFLPTPRIQYAIAKALRCQPLELWPLERQRNGR